MNNLVSMTANSGFTWALLTKIWEDWQLNAPEMEFPDYMDGCADTQIFFDFVFERGSAD
ncbi:MAG: hypothetical protein K2Q33_06845 [Gammaproteobacteria bacterium]|nr:hypothetical protein [Gammaproteobacteria bacterium]